MQNTVYVAKTGPAWFHFHISFPPNPHNCYRQICLTKVVGLVPRSTCSQIGDGFCGHSHQLFHDFSLSTWCRLNDAHSCSVFTGSRVRITTPIIGYCEVRCHFQQSFQKHAIIQPITFIIIFPLLQMRCQEIKQRKLPIFGNLQICITPKSAGCRSIQLMYQSVESSLTRYPHVTTVHIQQFIRI